MPDYLYEDINIDWEKKGYKGTDFKTKGVLINSSVKKIIKGSVPVKGRTLDFNEKNYQFLVQVFASRDNNILSYTIEDQSDNKIIRTLTIVENDHPRITTWINKKRDDEKIIKSKGKKIKLDDEKKIKELLRIFLPPLATIKEELIKELWKEIKNMRELLKDHLQ